MNIDVLRNIINDLQTSRIRISNYKLEITFNKISVTINNIISILIKIENTIIILSPIVTEDQNNYVIGKLILNKFFSSNSNKIHSYH